MRPVLLLPVLLIALPAFAQDNPFVSGVRNRPLPKVVRREPLMVQVARLKPNRPTDRTRAVLLARAYFEYHLGGCGGEATPLDKGRHWLFTTRVGNAGEPGPDILVDKRTGTTSAKGLPTVVDPSVYYRQPGAIPYWIDHVLR